MIDDDMGTRLARVEQRVSDIDTRLTAMVPIAGSVIQLTERVEVLRRDLKAYAGQVSKLDEEIERRERDRADSETETRRERRQARLAMWGLTATIVAALIVAAVTLLTSGGVH
jgi:chromosome segregation ATPase